MLEDYLKKTEPKYYPPVENLLDLIYEHYTENNPVEKNTVAGKAAKEKEKELQVSGFSGQRKAYLLIQNKHIPLHSPYFYR